jgi:hypothetical protein
VVSAGSGAGPESGSARFSLAQLERTTGGGEGLLLLACSELLSSSCIPSSGSPERCQSAGGNGSPGAGYQHG